MRFLGIGIVFLAMSVYAQQPVSKASELSGRVVNPMTKEGVPRASVRLYQSGEGNTRMYVVRTDNSGAFHAELASGTYSVECFKSGYMRPEGWTATIPSLTLAPGERLTGATCALAPAAAIEGTVFDHDGEPLGGVHVNVEKALRGSSVPVMGVANSNPTDSSGRFRISGLAPGRYLVGASPAGQDFLLQPEGPPRMQLFTFSPSSTSRKDAQVVVLRSGETGQADIRLVSVPVLKVRGKYLDASGNPKQTVVSVESPQVFSGYFRTATGEDGSFELEVPQGEWLLTGPRRDVSGQHEAMLPITVSDRPIGGLTLQASEPAAIVGNLEYGGAATSNESKVRVILKSAATGLHAGNLDFKGPSAFQFTDLLPGRYEFEVQNQDCDCYLASVFLNGQPVRGMEVDLAPGTQNQVTLRFERPAGRVEGTIEDKSEEGVLAAMVAFALPAGQRSGELLSIPFSEVRKDRKFTFRELRPGAYRIWAMINLEWEYLTDPTFVDEIEKHARTVTVKAGETTAVHVVVTPRPY